MKEKKIELWNIVYYYFPFHTQKKKKKNYICLLQKKFLTLEAEPEIFIWGGQVATLIYLSKQPLTYTYTHVFFIIYIFFYLISYIYIYTHTPKKKKKSLIFSIKIMFDGNFSWNKIHFYHFYSEILKKCHFRYKLSNIFIKTTSHIYIYTCFFIIYTFFYLISYIYIYIYTHTHQKKKKRA